MFWAKKSLATTYSPTAVCRSTIGAGGLNFRVRNGNGWVPAAIVTRLIILYRASASRRLCQAPRSFETDHVENCSAILLDDVFVVQSPRQLNTLFQSHALAVPREGPLRVIPLVRGTIGLRGRNLRTYGP